MSLVRRYPLTAFFVLACALSWWPWILYSAGLLPNPIVGFGPFLAALVVLAITEGKSGVMGLLRRMVRWRVRIQWYAAALLLPIVVTLAAAALNVFLLGAQRTSSDVFPLAPHPWPSGHLGGARVQGVRPATAAVPIHGTHSQPDPRSAVGLLAPAVRGNRGGHLD
jgi:hypothetical protein